MDAVYRTTTSRRNPFSTLSFVSPVECESFSLELSGTGDTSYRHHPTGSSRCSSPHPINEGTISAVIYPSFYANLGWHALRVSSFCLAIEQCFDDMLLLHLSMSMTTPNPRPKFEQRPRNFCVGLLRLQWSDFGAENAVRLNFLPLCFWCLPCYARGRPPGPHSDDLRRWTPLRLSI